MNYTGIGNLGGVYSEKVTTVGVPIKIGEENVVGAVFASAEMPYMSGLFAEFFRFFAFSSLLVLLLSFVTIYFMTARLVRPIKKMSNVAKQFAKGDFDERIAIDEDSEEEIAELATAFNNMAYSLKHLEEIRSSFVANVSHDLRTPMTTISGFVDGILDGTIPKEKEEYYLKIVSDETKRLARLTRTLLALSKIQDGQMKMIKAPFDICDLTGRIVVGFEQRISEKNIFIDIKFSKDTIRVLADYDSMYQVMYNLIDNAVKFCNQGGKITVEIREEKDKKVFISVKNTGAGIAEKDIPMVFDRFYKGDKSRSEDKGGSGLGLYIVKTIITAHDQEIKVRSAQNEYCEFYFTLARAE